MNDSNGGVDNKCCIGNTTYHIFIFRNQSQIPIHHLPNEYETISSISLLVILESILTTFRHLGSQVVVWHVWLRFEISPSTRYIVTVSSLRVRTWMVEGNSSVIWAVEISFIGRKEAYASRAYKLHTSCMGSNTVHSKCHCNQPLGCRTGWQVSATPQLHADHRAGRKEIPAMASLIVPRGSKPVHYWRNQCRTTDSGGFT